MPTPHEFVSVEGRFLSGHITSRSNYPFESFAGRKLNFVCEPFINRFNDCLTGNSIDYGQIAGQGAKVSYFIADDVREREMS